MLGRSTRTPDDPSVHPQRRVGAARPNAARPRLRVSLFRRLLPPDALNHAGELFVVKS
jgi:hypothetical protein